MSVRRLVQDWKPTSFSQECMVGRTRWLPVDRQSSGQPSTITGKRRDSPSLAGHAVNKCGAATVSPLSLRCSASLPRPPRAGPPRPFRPAGQSEPRSSRSSRRPPRCGTDRRSSDPGIPASLPRVPDRYLRTKGGPDLARPPCHELPVFKWSFGSGLFSPSRSMSVRVVKMRSNCRKAVGPRLRKQRQADASIAVLQDQMSVASNLEMTPNAEPDCNSLRLCNMFASTCIEKLLKTSSRAEVNDTCLSVWEPCGSLLRMLDWVHIQPSEI